MGYGFLIENEGLEHFWGNLGGVGAFEVHDMPASLTLEEEVDGPSRGSRPGSVHVKGHSLYF